MLKVLKNLFNCVNTSDAVKAFEKYCMKETVKPYVHRCSFMKRAHKIISESMGNGITIWNEQCYPEMSLLAYSTLIEDDVSRDTPERNGVALDAPKHIFIHSTSAERIVVTEAWCAICDQHIKTTRNIELPPNRHLTNFIHEHRNFKGTTTHKEAHLKPCKTQ